MAKIADRRRGPIVVVTGPECTGKTTLAAELGARYGAPVSGEFARAYQAARTSPLTLEDVEPIAIGQVHGEDLARRAAVRLVVADTDLVSTAVYSRHYYGTCPARVETAARVRLADLYLLLAPDVPWIADGLQRDRPFAREQLFREFRDALAALGARTVEISGDWDARRRAAFGAVETLLSSSPVPAGRSPRA
jgi:NadR type nicotinamide-nucleotide adenylyltransferase